MVLEQRIVRFFKGGRYGHKSFFDKYEVIAYRPKSFKGGPLKWVKHKTLATFHPPEFHKSEYANYSVVGRSPHLKLLTDEQRIAMDMIEDGQYDLVATIPRLYVAEE